MPLEPLPVVYVDADPFNANWTKKTWDLGIYNVEELREWIVAQGDTVEHFKSLPAYLLALPTEPWLADL